MLQAIREKSQGWFAYAIVIFITIPFALWGINSYLGVGSDPVAASVNGKDITQRDLDRQVRDYRENLRSRLGASYRPELFDDAMLRKQVTESMINDNVLEDAAKDWGLRVSDDLVRMYIRSIPAFQSNGKFDINTYNITLRNQGMSQGMFEERVRKQLMMDQFRNGISETAFPTTHQISELERLQDQQRDLSYLIVDADKLGKEITLSEEELKDYYQKNGDKFQVPERVKVEYLVLDPEVVGKQLKVTDEKLRAYYDEHKDEFQVPEERKVRHILVAVSESADAEKVKAAEAKIASLSQRLSDGESFEALAKEFSDDPGSAEQGGDVGWITSGMMAKAFEDKAFSLEKGKVSEAVRTPFGFHLIEVTDIKSGGEQNFDSLKDKINTAYRRAEAEQLFFDQAERFADLSYETPDSLAPAAESLGLKIQESDWFDRTGGKGELALPKVTAAAFSEDVLMESNNSELLELDQDKVLVLRVFEHEEEHVSPYEEVKDKVEAALRKEKATALATTAGESLLARLQAGETTLEEAAKAGDWKMSAPGMVKRNDTSAPREVVQKAFSLQRPAEGSVSYASVVLANGNFAALAVKKVVDGKPAEVADEAAQKAKVDRLGSQLGRAEFSTLGQYLRSQATIETEPN